MFFWISLYLIYCYYMFNVLAVIASKHDNVTHQAIFLRNSAKIDSTSSRGGRLVLLVKYISYMLLHDDKKISWHFDIKNICLSLVQFVQKSWLKTTVVCIISILFWQNFKICRGFCGLLYLYLSPGTLIQKVLQNLLNKSGCYKIF